MGDTMASELGILAPQPPRYILTGQKVPPGTNGGVTPFGTLVSGLGGASVGIVMVLDLLLERQICSTSPSLGAWKWATEMIVFATFSGFMGSLVDSFLGATLQQTMYSPKDKRILTDLSHRPGEKLQKVGAGMDLLSNSAVNFISGLVMVGLAFVYTA